MKPELSYKVMGPKMLCDKVHKVLSPLPIYPFGNFRPGAEVTTTGELLSDCREIITGKRRISPQMIFVAVFQWIYFIQSGRKTKKPSETRWVCFEDLLNLTKVLTPLELWRRRKKEIQLEVERLRPLPPHLRHPRRCRLRH